MIGGARCAGVGARPRLASVVLAACVLLVPGFGPGPAAAEFGDSCDVGAPLRIANLHPFHLPFAPPASYGACVLRPGSSEAIVSLDMASHLVGVRSESEWLFIDGETWRPALALRRGFRPGWEYLLEVSAISHGPGLFDGLIETWHSAFGLPQGGRDTGPRDQLWIFYARDGAQLVDIDDGTSPLGELTLGIGHAVRRDLLSNDGIAARGAVRMQTGGEAALADPAGLAAAIWAETSGVLSGAPRAWHYGAALGALVASPPDGLSALGGGLSGFGRLAVTWRALDRLSLTAQLGVASSPYRSSLAPLAGPAIAFGIGGRLKLSPRAALDIAVTEDDGWRRATPDFGLHLALRWRP